MLDIVLLSARFCNKIESSLLLAHVTQWWALHFIGLDVDVTLLRGICLLPLAQVLIFQQKADHALLDPLQKTHPPGLTVQLDEFS